MEHTPPTPPILADQHASIFLIGMMGAGKTTIGRILAKKLQRPFMDLDRVLEERCGVRIADIFELEGEAGFRRRETQLLDEVTQQRGIVLSTGGGAVLSPENRQRLRTRGTVVYLCTDTEELCRRLLGDRKRPLLQVPDPKAHIHTLLQQREPLYAQTAHLAFNTCAMSVMQVVWSLHKRLYPHTTQPEP